MHQVEGVTVLQETTNPYQLGAPEYDRVRPHYPLAIRDCIAACLSRTDTANASAPLTNCRILEVGAGTGILTRQLRSWFPAAQLTVVEPSATMITQLQPSTRHPRTTLVAARLEDLATHALGPFDLAIFGQSYHWLDPGTASAILASLLPNGASVIVANNQLRVELAWVKRLTRIMRSGDVHRRERPPRFDPPFPAPTLQIATWQQTLNFGELMALARTRSSYLRSSPVNRARMQANLQWYLTENLGCDGVRPINLPYETHIWVTQRTAS